MQHYCHRYTLIALAALLFAGCRKTSARAEEPAGETTELREGLPGNSANIDGYFYTYQYSPTLIAYACVRDPSENLMSTINHRTSKLWAETTLRGNIDLQEIYYTNKHLNKMLFNRQCYYNYEANNTTDTLPSWKTGSNKVFLPLNQQVTRNYPIIAADTACAQTIHVSSGASYNINDLAGNFDTLLITLTDGYYYTTPIYKKAIKGDTSVVFTPAELSKLHSTAVYAFLYLQAFNYSWRMLNGKTYVFELARRKDYAIPLEP